MPTVWRLQGPDGLGPYQGTTICSELYGELTRAHNDFDHPSWNEDGIQAYYSDWLSGCRTRKKLVEWFGEFLELLIEEGCEIVKVEAAATVSGASGKQLAFLPRSS